VSLNLAAYDGGGEAYYNIQTGVVTNVSAGSTAKIENYGNGWYRCSLTSAIGATDLTGRPSIYVANDGTTSDFPSTAAATGKAAYAWGFNMCLGSYVQSYLPTLGASVTRVQDAASKTGISSLIGQTEGTLFVDFNWEQKSGVFFVNSISDGTTVNEIFIAFGSTADNRLRFSIASSGVGASVSFDSATLASGRYKVAFAYANNDAAAYINGVQQFTDTSVTIPATSAFKFLRANDTLGFNGTINQQLLFKTRLTNAQLAELTTI
jgi:hypothetical protein